MGGRVVETCVVLERYDGDEHVGHPDGFAGERQEVEVVRTLEHAAVERSAEAIEERVIAIVAARHLVVGDDPRQDAEVRHVAFGAVEGLHRVLAPLPSVVLTYGRRVDDLYEFGDEPRHGSSLVGIDVGDIGESVGEHGAAIDGPFALILQADDRRGLVDERFGRGDDLLHQPVGTFKDVFAFLFPCAAFAAHAEVFLRPGLEVEGQGRHPFHGRPASLEVAEVKELREFGVHIELLVKYSAYFFASGRYVKAFSRISNITDLPYLPSRYS